MQFSFVLRKSITSFVANKSAQPDLIRPQVLGSLLLPLKTTVTTSITVVKVGVVMMAASGVLA